MPLAPAHASSALVALDRVGSSDGATTARNIYEALVSHRALASDGPVINSITGHLYYQPIVINLGSATLGDCEMSRDPRRQSKEDTRAITPPSSDTGTGSHTQMFDPGDPAEYRIRQADWFIPGRIFRIWGEQDVEIHKKMFVLLDTKNVEGPGLLIHNYGDEEEKAVSMGYFHRTHVLVQNFEQGKSQNFDSQTREKVVYLDEYEEQRVAEHTYIELEHQYNIPFEKYPCIDCGVLARSSLKHLRRCYLKWLHYHWDID